MSAEPTECLVCGPLLTWTVARGPRKILARIEQMIALVGSGFTELRDHTRPALNGMWSELPPDAVTEDLVINGPGMTDPQRVHSWMTLQCERCGRTFSQRWTYERGNESWVVEPSPPE